MHNITRHSWIKTGGNMTKLVMTCRSTDVDMFLTIWQLPHVIYLIFCANWPGKAYGISILASHYIKIFQSKEKTVVKTWLNGTSM